MSSRFVSGGAIDAASGQAVEAPGPARQVEDKPVGKNQQEWEAVSREMEEEKKRREESRAKEAAGEQQSLFDILQANKGIPPPLQQYLSHAASPLPSSSLLHHPPRTRKFIGHCVSFDPFFTNSPRSSREASCLRGEDQDQQPVPRPGRR
jgi:hypothetical protein